MGCVPSTLEGVTRPAALRCDDTSTIDRMKGGEGWDVFQVHWKEFHDTPIALRCDDTSTIACSS